MFTWLQTSKRASRSPGALALALAAALALALPVAEAVAQNVFNSDCLPPLTGTYAGQFHAKYSDGTNVYDLTDPRHSKFTPCTPPPSGPGIPHSFSSFAGATMSVNGGPGQSVGGSANTTTVVNMTGASGPTRFFDTEMLQLDISGGPVLIRESPSKQSLGKTSITDVGGGNYRIDSFFDVFTELSVDGGQTWMPSTDAAGNPYAGRVMIPGTVAVQTVPWSQVKVLYQQP